MADSAPNLTLVVLAAGLSSRYGSLKQLEPVGPCGEALMDYGVFDAARAGFDKAVFVVRREIEDAVRSHVESLVHGAIEIAFVRQDLWDLPPGFSVPTGRTKPWGTAHAVLAAEGQITGPFAVCNADDFYGAPAYLALATHLRNIIPDRVPTAALVGYDLESTLSETGGVSRAICDGDAAGFLAGIEEVKDVIRNGANIVGTTVMGRARVLGGAETVSMNLWGFSPALVGFFRKSFASFLATTGRNTNSEFLIPSVVAEMIAEEKARVRILEAGTEWMGITFSEDRQRVAGGIRRLVDRGEYPDDLSAAFKQP